MNFDENFLTEMGLSSMPADRKQAFLGYLQDKFETRIGQRISKGLTDEQLNEFDFMTDLNMAASWLEKNRPDYKTIVEKTIDEMKAEIAANREKLLAQNSSWYR